MRTWKGVVLHHSGGRHDTVAGVRREHIVVRKWNDVGYHYMIDPLGAIWAGRPLEMVGAHAFGYNSTHLGVCFIGLDVNPAQLKAFTELFLLLAKKYGFAARDLIGHKETRAGRLIGKIDPLLDMDHLRQELA